MRYACIFFLCLLAACKSKQNFINEAVKASANLNENHVLLDLVNVENDQVKVTFKPMQLKEETAIFHLPAIIPGTYSLDNYGQFVSELTATDYSGGNLKVNRINDNSWQIDKATTLQQITYVVDDTFDTESQHHLFSPAGTNVSKNKNFVLNLHSFIGYFKETIDRPYQVSVLNNKALVPATSAISRNPNNDLWRIDKMADLDTFQFDRYATLIDNPVMYAYSDTQRFQLSNVNVSFSVYSPNRIHDAVDLLPTVKKTMQAQRQFIGNIQTTNRYHVILYLSENTQNDAFGYGALEHNNSTFIVLPEALSKEKLEIALVDIISHEFFHIITPLNIHSEQIHHFNYQNPDMSAHLWFYEGVTEYFAQLFQVQQKLISKQDFFSRIVQKLELSYDYQSDLSFTEMSRNILEEKYQQEYQNVYYKGALIAMCLDILIQKESSGEKDLRWLMQQLSVQFGSEKAFEDSKLVDIIANHTTPVVYDFLQKHVVEGIPIDYTTFFNYVGLQYGLETSAINYFEDVAGNSVINIDKSKNQITFQKNVSESSFFTDLGIQKGDILVAVNGQKYDTSNILFLIQISKKWLKGHPVIFMVNRSGENIIKETIVKEGINNFEKKLLEIPEKELTNSQKTTKNTWLN